MFALADLDEKLLGLLSDAELRRLQGVLASGSANDVKASERIAAVLRAGPAGRIEALRGVFLTTGGEARKNLLTQGLVAAHPDAHALLTRAQGAFLALDAERRKLALLDAAMALIRLGNAVLQRYGDAKARCAALDFDDLVARTASLLRSSAAVEWVLYKLDGGLDHILVDEAQDTSPVQWQVIRALAEEFFSGAGASEAARTLFAVGDEKQSIYGFQGAAPTMFAETGEAFAARAGQARLPWRRVPLNLSFRATEPLLAAVDRIFAAPERTPGVGTSPEPIAHVAHRAGLAGLVEVWPTEKHEQPARSEPWSPLEETGTTPSAVRLAARIAQTIDGWLESGEKLESEDRPLRAGDILILVRKRAPFAAAMISALKLRGIKVAGADRLVLTEQIAVQDLIALGDFLVLPEDDLALAAVLKSPLIGLDDDDLLALAPKRQGSLWQELVARAGTNARLGQGRRDLEALARARRAGGAVRALCGAARRRRHARAHAGAARDRGGGRHRRVPQPGARLRRRRPAVAAGLLELAARRHPRGEARHGAGQRRGARHDRARRQGTGGARRVPARHLLHPVGAVAREPPEARRRGAAVQHAGALPVAGEGDERSRCRAAGQGGGGAGGDGRAQPAALRGADARARPALCGGLRGREPRRRRTAGTI